MKRKISRGFIISLHSTRTRVQINRLEVSVATAPTSIAPRVPQPSKFGIHHRVIPRLLAPCSLWQPKGLQHVGRQTSGYAEVLGDLIFRDGVTRSRTEKAVGWTVVIAQLSELHLNVLDRGISHRNSIMNGPGVIPWRNVSVVIVRVIIVAVVGIVIPWKKSGI